MKPPIKDQQPPYVPVLELSPHGSRRLAHDQHGHMWVWPPRRLRTYICSRGIEHFAYWRTHWRQGRNDYVACEHEVTYR